MGAKSVQTQSGHVLLIEDNQDDIDLTLRALRLNDVDNEVVVVRDGAAAVDYLLRSDRAGPGDSLPRLVLLDINLPKVSGLDVLRRLRENERTRVLPIVMLSTSSHDRDVRESYASGANSYIVKPVSFGEFTETVRQLGAYWLLLNHGPWSTQP